VGFAEAVRLCVAETDSESARLRAMRDRLYAQLRCQIGDVTLVGPGLEQPNLRLAGNLNVSFAGLDGEALMMSMPELAVSSGAACSSSDPEPSHVLRALGLSDDATRASLRFGLGRFNSRDEIDAAVNHVGQAVGRLRKLASAPTAPPN
jgi:cysteine desulfurase